MKVIKAAGQDVACTALSAAEELQSAHSQEQGTAKRGARSWVWGSSNAFFLVSGASKLVRNIHPHQMNLVHHPSLGLCIMSDLKHCLTFKLCSAEKQKGRRTSALVWQESRWKKNNIRLLSDFFSPTTVRIGHKLKIRIRMDFCLFVVIVLFSSLGKVVKVKLLFSLCSCAQQLHGSARVLKPCYFSVLGWKIKFESDWKLQHLVKCWVTDVNIRLFPSGHITITLFSGILLN